MFETEMDEVGVNRPGMRSKAEGGQTGSVRVRSENISCFTGRLAPQS